MRVKVGSAWHEVHPGSPLAVELTEADKRNIVAMHPECSRYAVFDEPDRDRDWMRKWIAE